MAVSTYLFVGDRLLVGEKAAALIAKIGESLQGEIATQTYHLSESSLEKILSEARSLPFMVRGQVFRLKEAENLKSPDLDLLTAYLQHPSFSTCLIFEASQLSHGNPLVKLIQEYGEVSVLEGKDKRSAISRFIRQKLAQFGKTMTPPAMARLEEQTQDAPMFLDSILMQLISYAGTEKQINEEMVEKFEENWREIDAFQFMNAVANRKTEDALVLLKELMAENEDDVLSIIGLLHWHLRRLWRVSLMLARGESESQAFKACRVSPKQAPFFRRQLNLFKQNELEQALENLFHLDRKIKTGQIEGPLGMETWLVQTISR